MSETTLTERRLAYMAGIVDVMGNLRLREVNHSGTLLPFVEVACPNILLLERLGEWTGSAVTKVRRDYRRNGCTKHCPEPHVHIQSSSGRWSVSGVRATVVLHGLLPYLELQADQASELLEAGLVAPRKPATIRKLAELGWVIPEFRPPIPKVST